MQCLRNGAGKGLQGGRQGKILDLQLGHHRTYADRRQLLYITPHSYFWAEDGTQVNEGEMKALMDTFEEQDLSHRPGILRQ